MDTIKIMAFDPITSWQIQGEKVEVVQILFGGAPKSLWTVTIAIILKDTCSFYNITDSMDMNLRKLQETVEDRGAWQPSWDRKSQTLLDNKISQGGSLRCMMEQTTMYHYVWHMKENFKVGERNKRNEGSEGGREEEK